MAERQQAEPSVSTSSSGIVALNSLGFQANMEGQHCKVWDGLHVSPRLAPSKGAKLCTYFAWFLRPGRLGFEGSCYFYIGFRHVMSTSDPKNHLLTLKANSDPGFGISIPELP